MATTKIKALLIIFKWDINKKANENHPLLFYE
jgi:hypothetical protein